GPDVGARGKAVERAVGAQEGFLDQVLGVMGVPSHAVGGPVQRPQVRDGLGLESFIAVHDASRASLQGETTPPFLLFRTAGRQGRDFDTPGEIFGPFVDDPGNRVHHRRVEGRVGGVGHDVRRNGEHEVPDHPRGRARAGRQQADPPQLALRGEGPRAAPQPEGVSPVEPLPRQPDQEAHRRGTAAQEDRGAPGGVEPARGGGGVRPGGQPVLAGRQDRRGLLPEGAGTAQPGPEPASRTAPRRRRRPAAIARLTLNESSPDPRFCLPFLRLCGAVLLFTASVRPATATSTLIREGRVIDGTGAPARLADVRLEGDRIVSVEPGLRPAAGEKVVEARGKVVAPGFIDLHNHSDRQIFEMPDAATQAAQGITTLVVGVDGGGPLPVGEFLARLDAAPAAVNVATMVGEGNVRTKVMGEDFKRPARPAEIAAMRELVAQGMDEGAFGLSSGLEYDPGYYSTTDELVALAEVAAARGGFYATHIRNEADETMRALAEAMEIGWRAHIPVHISHLKLGTVGVWGRTAEALRILHDAARENDVTADWYPYNFWASTTYVLTPGRDFEDRQTWV